jgi:hypothetical protein
LFISPFEVHFFEKVAYEKKIICLLFALFFLRIFSFISLSSTHSVVARIAYLMAPQPVYSSIACPAFSLFGLILFACVRGRDVSATHIPQHERRTAALLAIISTQSLGTRLSTPTDHPYISNPWKAFPPGQASTWNLIPLGSSKERRVDELVV